MSELYNTIYALVEKIPRGFVSTYGIIGKKLNVSPRVVGYALHANPNSSKTPCHRVVNREGRVAPGYAFGGSAIQKKLLEAEGVKFKDTLHVDLAQHLFTFKA